MATGRKSKPKIVKQVLLRKNDVTFDANGWMVIKSPKIKRLIEQRWLAAGIITPTNIICPRPPAPPPPPDIMCACAYITIGQEIKQSRTDQVRSDQARTGQVGSGGLRNGRLRKVPGRGNQRTQQL